MPRFVLRALCHGAMEELPRSALLIELIDIVNGLKSAAGTPAHRPGIPGSWTFTDGLQ